MLSFFPLDVLDEIWDLVESVSEGFLTYSCPRSGLSGLTGGFLLLRIFRVAFSVSPHVYFILDLTLTPIFLRQCTYELGIFHANQTTKCLRDQSRTKGEGWSTAN